MISSQTVSSVYLDRFRLGISRNAFGWLAFVKQQDRDIPALDREFPNLTRAVSQALLEPTAGEVGIALTLALCPLIERRRPGIGWEKLLERALAVSDNLHRLVDRAGLLNGRGRLARFAGDFALARTQHEEALAIYRGLHDLGAVGGVLIELSQEHLGLGDYETAEKCSQEAAAILERVGNRKDLAHAHVSWGLVCIEFRRLDAALEHYATASALFERYGDRRNQADILINEGNVHRRKGDLERAEACYNRSAFLYQEMDNEVGAAYARLHLSIVLHKQGRTAEALALHLEIGPVFRRANERPWMARTAHNQGVFLTALGRKEEAARAYAEAADLHLINGDRTYAADSLIAWAELHLDHAEADEAQQRLRRAKELLQTLPAPPLWLTQEYEAQAARAATLVQPE